MLEINYPLAGPVCGSEDGGGEDGGGPEEAGGAAGVRLHVSRHPGCDRKYI